MKTTDDPIFEKLLQKPKRKRLDKSKNDNTESGADDEENSGKQIEINHDHPQHHQQQQELFKTRLLLIKGPGE
jgi:hypothetical protein